MAAREKPSKGGKPDKLMRDALILELHEEAELAPGVMTKKLRLAARAVVDAAVKGDVSAFKEIADRVDGKAPQGITLGGDPDNPLVYENGARDELRSRFDKLEARRVAERGDQRLN